MDNETNHSCMWFQIIYILTAFGQLPRLGLKESNDSFQSHNNSKLDELYN